MTSLTVAGEFYTLGSIRSEIYLLEGLLAAWLTASSYFGNKATFICSSGNSINYLITLTGLHRPWRMSTDQRIGPLRDCWLAVVNSYFFIKESYLS